MNYFDKEDYENSVLLPKANDIVGFFDPAIVLKSGRPGHWYINMRSAVNSLPERRRLAKFIYDFAVDNQIEPDYFMGVPDGATPVGVQLNMLHAERNDEHRIPGGILRSGAKAHGIPSDRYSVGSLPADSHVVLVEDVTTTGGSSMEFILRLQEIGVYVDALISCASRYERRDRGRTVQDVLERDYGVPYFPLTDARRILPKAIERDKPPASLIKDIEDYYKRYGIEPLKLS